MFISTEFLLVVRSRSEHIFCGKWLDVDMIISNHVSWVNFYSQRLSSAPTFNLQKKYKCIGEYNNFYHFFLLRQFFLQMFVTANSRFTKTIFNYHAKFPNGNIYDISYIMRYVWYIIYVLDLILILSRGF